jgi:hypothetical protein
VGRFCYTTKKNEGKEFVITSLYTPFVRCDTHSLYPHHTSWDAVTQGTAATNHQFVKSLLAGRDDGVGAKKGRIFVLMSLGFGGFVVVLLCWYVCIFISSYFRTVYRPENSIKTELLKYFLFRLVASQINTSFAGSKLALWFSKWE